MNKIIEVKNLNKTFKRVNRKDGIKAAVKSFFKPQYTEAKALKNISFEIGEGDIVGYIGPNGAGKSTTIKIMSGILHPDEGECIIDGRTPWENREKHVRNIGVVFGQRSQLWWDVPVNESFALLKEIYKIPDEIYKENMELLVETLGLKEFINSPVRQLSLGQRMRCEIGASLLHDPKILFLDEPTIGLDAVSKVAVREFIKKINEEKKVTVILTTHDMSDIEALANRIILIGKGQVLMDGNLEELKKKFGSAKVITVDFKETDKEISIKGTQIIKREPGMLKVMVDSEQMTPSEVIGIISKEVEVRDINVENKPIDEIIVELYKEFKI